VILQTKWGDFQYEYEAENSVVITGAVQFGGQDYSVMLRLFERKGRGWGRRSFEDFILTKVGGPNAGKPARPVARELVMDYLPEHFNDVIGVETRDPVEWGNG